ncbi:biotin--[acetyl-CoA-carboxylase] ligase [Blastococcus sp. Marseille-P5729]|uniref:biotin--[acetyl-CoA-carboxylase] ligase n=1 Tax=Blastococcus sp. Marseille-P5729 TaxID=2086582 RepID=UPI00131CD62F|nr:biotin--[acetyl-CoA-carboxylase] ligase [Blastococcus sp. Marseille-P5729]
MSFDADAVRRELDPFWSELQAVGETGSTNDDVLAEAARGTPQGLVRTAEFQTAGRGRLDRGWEAPPGTSVMFSILLRPQAPVRHWGWIPILAGMGVYDALQSAAVDAALKWPNDVQLGPDRGKCGGILTQAAAGAAVVGIGLNVRSHDRLPETAEVIGDYWDISRERLLAAVLNAIAARYRRWDGAAGDVVRTGLLADYRTACGTLGQRVRVELPGGAPPALGIAEDVDQEGRLVVRTADGPVVVGAGDVIHVRPTG